MQRRGERVDAGLAQELHEGDVERLDERIAHRDESAVIRVEVGRPVAAVGARDVRKARLGRDESALDGEGDEERLEGRAGGTRCSGGVDLSGGVPEVVAAACERDGRAVAHAHHRGGDGVAARPCRGVDGPDARLLDVGVERRRQVAASARRGLVDSARGERPVAEVRMEEGARRATHLGNDRFRGGQLLVGDEIERTHPPEHVVAAVDGAVEMAVGAKARRRLHYAGEQCGLAEPELLRAAAEPSLSCRLDADEVRAVGRAIEILRENPRLRLRALHLQRLDGLLPLPPEGLRVRTDEPHRLHGDRRGAGDAPAEEEILSRRADDAQRPHPVMSPERAVLGGDERLHDPVIGARDVARPAVDVTVTERDTQDVPGAVAYDDAPRVAVRPLIRPPDERPRCREEDSHAKCQRLELSHLSYSTLTSPIGCLSLGLSRRKEMILRFSF